MDFNNQIGVKTLPDYLRTRRMAENQDEYYNLDLFDRPVPMYREGEEKPELINQQTFFLDLTDAQRKAIADGADISIGLLGVVFPPVQIQIEEIPAQSELDQNQLNWIKYFQDESRRIRDEIKAATGTDTETKASEK